MKDSRTYASQEVQDAFLTLPESNQDALAAIHETEAYLINDSIRSSVHGLIETSLDLPNFKEYFSVENLGAPHWNIDTMEYANHRLAILKNHFKDNPEVLKKLENIEFQIATDFATGEDHPALFLKDFSVLGQFAPLFKWKGMNTRNVSIDPDTLPMDQEKKRWIFLRRDEEEGDVLLWNHTYFANDLTGLNPIGSGELRLIKGRRGIGNHCISQGKSLQEIQSHMLPVDAQIVFFNEAIPWDVLMKAFLLNQPLIGSYLPFWNPFRYHEGHLAILASSSSKVSGGRFVAGNTLLIRLSDCEKNACQMMRTNQGGYSVCFLSDAK